MAETIDWLRLIGERHELFAQATPESLSAGNKTAAMLRAAELLAEGATDLVEVLGAVWSYIGYGPQWDAQTGPEQQAVLDAFATLIEECARVLHPPALAGPAQHAATLLQSLLAPRNMSLTA